MQGSGDDCRALKMILYTFCLLLQPLLELGSKYTSLSSGFSDVIKAARYDLLIQVGFFGRQTGIYVRLNVRAQ